mgnify:CR=1 FL=1
MTNFILGCANFFYEYGLKESEPLSYNINKILDNAIENGVNDLDSALVYENNKVPLSISNNISTVINVGTKIGIKNIDIDKPKTISKLKENLKKSLNLWGKDKFEYIYCHEIISTKNDLNKWQYIEDILKRDGFCKDTGISIYHVEDLEIFKNIKLDRIQMPDNLYWQKDEKSLENVQRTRNNIDVRSIFLQGVIVNEPQKIKNKIPKSLLLHHSKIWQKFNSNKIKLYDLSLSYIKRRNYNNVVFGVENTEELNKFIRSFKKANELLDFSEFKYNEIDIDPRTWGK